MTDRATSRSQRSEPRRPSSLDAAAADAARVGEPEIAGIVGGATATRSGEDVRRRGWFWHWNSIVTQYAPLLGLKGVGLLNSYTVWTDRREESPTRGYAFPTQQSEADFYGEDRAELITINKLLVALDLIEIRKEMVVRADEQGRRWKVPHNFYRVKDHGDGSRLTGKDVLRVIELADRDAAVYRYIRRIFSPKFSPIDRDNVWVAILAELAGNDIWVRLQARATAEEAKASARTKAGHAARKGLVGVPAILDQATPGDGLEDSTTVTSKRGRTTSVAATNNGFDTDVGGTNEGLIEKFTSSVELVNGARASGVDPTNTTYNQEELTTTTTGNLPEMQRISGLADSVDSSDHASQRPVTSLEKAVTGLPPTGPDARLAPFDAPGEKRAISAFEDANGRAGSRAERSLLREIAERCDEAARTRGGAGMASGWEWITAAIYEAVDSGSAYVAPRRIREIVTRWERDGLPGRVTAADWSIQVDSIPVDVVEQSPDGPAAIAASRILSPTESPALAGEFMVVECGLPSTQVWAAVLDELAARGEVSRTNIEAWLRSSRLIGRTDSGGLIVLAAHTLAQRRIASRFAEPLAGAAATILGRALDLHITSPGDLTAMLAEASGAVEVAEGAA